MEAATGPGSLVEEVEEQEAYQEQMNMTSEDRMVEGMRTAEDNSYSEV